MRDSAILEIDLGRISENYQKICRSSKADVGAVLKADAYGLGALQIYKHLYKTGCKNFFVSSIDEAFALEAKSDSNIFIFNGIWNLPKIKYPDNFIFVVSDLYQLDILRKYSKTKNVKVKIALHFETGMNRYGIPLEEFENYKNSYNLSEEFNIVLIMSHLASADLKNDPQNITQLNLFNKVTSYFKDTPKSLSNSAASVMGDEYHYDLIRPGAALYGLRLNEQMSDFKNPIRLFAPLIHIKHLAKGEEIGYNHTYKLQKDSIIGTVPMGYADGLFRMLSNKGCLYIKEQKVDIVGRVSMDYVNIDLTNIKQDLKIGLEVDIISDINRPDEICKLCNTVPYEITTSIGTRCKRIYVNE